VKSAFRSTYLDSTLLCPRARLAPSACKGEERRRSSEINMVGLKDGTVEAITGFGAEYTSHTIPIVLLAVVLVKVKNLYNSFSVVVKVTIAFFERVSPPFLHLPDTRPYLLC
jgi:hypothetical protein